MVNKSRTSVGKIKTTITIDPRILRALKEDKDREFRSVSATLEMLATEYLGNRVEVSPAEQMAANGAPALFPEAA